MYCRNCGKELNEETRFCPACGSKQYEASSNASFDDPFTTTTTTEIEDKPAKCWSVFAKVGKILGIVAISTAIIPWLIGFVAGVYGIVFSCLGMRAIDEEAIENRKKGLTLSIIGAVIGMLSFIIYYAIVFGSIIRYY